MNKTTRVFIPFVFLIFYSFLHDVGASALKNGSLSQSRDKGAQVSGDFKVTLDIYTEHSTDTSTKCIAVCVTSTLSGKPRCNLNTTTWHSTVKPSHGYPSPYQYSYLFSSWEENSELSVTIWSLPSGKTCDTSSPDNTTIHGNSKVHITRNEDTKQVVLKDPKHNWTLHTFTKLTCNINTPNCLCVTRDDNTGHYISCKENEKKCLPNWYGSKCLKKCVPQNDSFGRYNCSSLGGKICYYDWLDENCTCDKNATNYNCTSVGKKVCLPEWFGNECHIFCGKNATNYLCANDGKRVCLPHWYGENCTKFCDNSETAYKCNDQGQKVCSYNWYGKNCTIFCNNSEATYKCNGNGEKITLRDCDMSSPEEVVLKRNSDVNVSYVQLLGGLFGTLFLTIMITTIVVVCICRAKKRKAMSDNSSAEFAPDYNGNDDKIAFNVDSWKIRNPVVDVENHVNCGMIADNPLYETIENYSSAKIL